MEPCNTYKRMTGAPTEKARKEDTTKPDVYAMLEDFPDALIAVTRAGDYGAAKYGRHNWWGLPGARERYLSAAMRHILEVARGLLVDPESGQRQLAHAAWSILAALQEEIEPHQKQP